MADEMELYQGDSSDVVSTSVYSAGVLVEDLDGYTGVFSVVEALGEDPLVEKEMEVVNTAFRVALTPTESEELAPGEYIGVVEIENTGIGFRKERHVTITVRKQGYEAA